MQQGQGGLFIDTLPMCAMVYQTRIAGKKNRIKLEGVKGVQQGKQFKFFFIIYNIFFLNLPNRSYSYIRLITFFKLFYWKIDIAEETNKLYSTLIGTFVFILLKTLCQKTLCRQHVKNYGKKFRCGIIRIVIAMV